MNKIRILSNLIIYSTAFCLLLISCETKSHKEERLAKMYCGSCHLFPDPTLLDKKTWKSSVLPQMAFRMGLGNSDILWGVTQQDMAKVLETLPPGPILTKEEWKLIENYFARKAPDSIPYQEHESMDTITQFISRPLAIATPRITLIQMDNLHHTTYIGTQQSKLYKLDSKLNSIDSFQLSSAPSHIQFADNTLFISLMGIMNPNDQAKGALVSLDLGDHREEILVNKLQRPVYFEKTDINGDSEDDIVISAFGNFTGALQLYKHDHDSFILQNLNMAPGARKTITMDVNRDGLKDIVALMTQGDERLVLYLNKGSFTFEEKTLLRFPPVYGSNYFEMVDFNKDGFLDVLYTNGDNGDFSPIFKPYHGVKIFLNDGKNNFKEYWSYSMSGASQANAVDFDSDGDLDIAAISFFPDFSKHPEYGFNYFENDGHNRFKPLKTSLAAFGRWLVMETGDFDNDRDIDIMLGAFNSKGFGNDKNIKVQWNESKSVLFLENKLH